nr:hypothetical protein [Candidatus Ozemobacteraceae bacterium]
ELISIIDRTWKIKVTGWQFGHSLMNPGFMWSYSHLFEIYRTLYVLPRIFFVGSLDLCWTRCMPTCSSICHLQGNSIFFCNYAPMREGWLSVLFMREMARHLFLSKEFAYLRAQWIKMFWLDERIIKIQPPFKFVCKTPDEDFGESVKSYWCCGDWFRSRDEARFEFVHRLVMKGKKFSWGNGGCGCDESDADVVAEPKKPVATATKPIGNGDHGASGKVDLNDKNKIDNASKANNTPKQVAPVVKTPAPVTKTTTVKQPVQPVKPAVTPAKTPAPVVKPVTTAPAKQPAQPTKPVATPVKAPTAGNGDHGASGKADLNDKNKVNNASKANNTANQAAKPTVPAKAPTPAAKPVVTAPAKTPAPAAKPVIAAPAKQPAQPAKPVATPVKGPAAKAATPAKPAVSAPAKAPASGNGDHGASGKADLNDKNKVNNASKANNTASQAAKSTATAASSKASSTSAAASAKNSTSGNGDHGASGKADQNDKNKANNAATANNNSAKK